jgi:hypothetical protein
MADTDELYSVKNNFWLGNFQVSHKYVRPLRISSVHRPCCRSCQCHVCHTPQDAISEARSLRLKPDALRLERDVYVYRSLIGLRNFK